MFIEIGNGNIIQSSKIVAMIDYELVRSSSSLQEMLDRAKTENKLKGSLEDVKSLTVTTDAIYVSSLSVPTLKKRTSMKAAFKNIEDFH